MDSVLILIDLYGPHEEIIGALRRQVESRKSFPENEVDFVCSLLWNDNLDLTRQHLRVLWDRGSRMHGGTRRLIAALIRTYPAEALSLWVDEASSASSNALTLCEISIVEELFFRRNRSVNLLRVFVDRFGPDSSFYGNGVSILESVAIALTTNTSYCIYYYTYHRGGREVVEFIKYCLAKGSKRGWYCWKLLLSFAPGKEM